MLKDKKVLVFGAKSGISASRLLRRVGASVILYDGRDDIDIDTFEDEIAICKNLEAYLGDFPKEKLDGLDLIL